MLQKPRVEDVKDDELLKFLLISWDYIENNYPKILAGLGVVVAAVLIAIFINRHQDQTALEAQTRLGEAQIALFQSSREDALMKSQQVATQYGDSPAGRQALLMAANLQYDSQQFTEAQAEFQKFIDAFGGEGPQGFSAWSGLAFCLEAQGNPAAAGQKFAAYAEAQSQTPFAPIALKEAARCFKMASDLGQAQAMYQKIVDQYPKSAVARTAESELSQMGINTN